MNFVQVRKRRGRTLSRVMESRWQGNEMERQSLQFRNLLRLRGPLKNDDPDDNEIKNESFFKRILIIRVLNVLVLYA